MRNLLTLTVVVFMCLIAATAAAQPTASYTLNETAPGAWDLLVDITGTETAGLSAYEIYVDVDPTSVNYTENTLAVGTTRGFMPATMLEGVVDGNFNAGNYQNSAASAAIPGIGMVAVDDAPVSLGAQALLGTLTTPYCLGAGDFRTPVVGLLNSAGDGHYNANYIVPTLTVNPVAAPTVHYTFRETAPDNWTVSVDVAGIYTAGLSSYEFFVDGVDEANLTYTENTLATATTGFLSPAVQGNVGSNFNAGNYQAFEGGAAILGIGMVAVSDAPVSLDAHALLGTLTTTVELVEADFRVVAGGTGLLDPTGNGCYDTTSLVPTMEVIPLASIPGDTDYDMDVDINDLIKLAANYGGTGGWTEGDFTGEGLVNINDLIILAGNYGTVAPITGNVPEPASLTLIGLGSLALIRRKRK